MSTVTFQVKAGPRRRLRTVGSTPRRVQLWVRAPEPDTPDAPFRYRETRDPKRAARFTLRRYPTVAENDQIRMRTHDAVGGIQRYMEIQTGIQQLSQIVRGEVEQALWADGRPETEDDAEQEAFDDAFEAAWEMHESEAIMALVELQSLLSRASFRAAWPYLVVDPPEGWEDLDAMEMPAQVLGWIREAYYAAVSQLDGDEGNDEASSDD